MGKRKSKAKVMKKAKRKTPTIFDCPFCNHRQTVECIFEKKQKTATIRCRMCGASYQMVTNALTKPIDVFSEWIDRTEEINNREDDDYDFLEGEAEKKKVYEDEQPRSQDIRDDIKEEYPEDDDDI
mmetsp:Transcript_2261/g.3250  ORF Transcript_2261/g.3250 Transcript_2261/m.3250 type:complete len:126 (+) Transcript_2261:47-424(+)